MLTLLRIGWMNLKRDRVAQALTFLLPILFFSIFASVFGGRGGDSTPRVSVAVADEDRSEFSGRVIAALQKEKALRLRVDGDNGSVLDRAAAEGLVRNGDVPVAIVIPKGIGESFGQLGFSSSGPAIQMLADPSDPIAPQMVQGLLQKVAMTAAPDLVMQGGMKQFEKHAGALTPEQRKAVDEWIPTLKADAGGTTGGGGTGGSGGMGIAVTVVDVMRNDDRKGSLISFYAAGIGVMFLLFSSVGGAGGALLEEAESGTLERLLSTNIGMTGVLIGKWLFLSLIGFAQLTVMFLWGRVAFGLPLFSHIPGFVVMTVVTAAAAAALGLVLASLARTRAQLSGFSTILILTMSALGGSMFPRFLMSETMQKMGLLTFNGWALDGYLKVFWRNAAVWELWPQVLVLVRARRHVPRNRAAARPSLGARVIGWRGALAVALAASAMALSAGGCKNIDVRTEAYATLAEAQAAGAVDRGWLPRGLPPGTRELRVAHDADSNRRWGLFDFPPEQGDALRTLVGPEISFDGLECNPPGRIEWWPILLRQRLDGERIKATSLQGYTAREGDLILAVNWAQGRAYYWSRE